MMKLIIVEDEPAILQGIEQMVRSMELDVEIAGTFMNGKNALERLCKGDIDVVLTDIRMPLVDGLEMIKTATHKGLGTRFIVLSGYGEFEYARTAMQYGVSDYILKPPVFADLKEAIIKTMQQAAERKNEQEYEMLHQLIFSGIDKITPKFEQEMKQCYGYLLLVCAGSFSMWSDSTILPDTSIWNARQIEQQAQNKLGQNSKCYVFDSQSGNEKLIFLSAESDGIMPVKRLVNQLARYEEQLNMPVNIVLSEMFQDIRRLGELYHKIRLSMSNHAVIGRSHMAVMDEADERQTYISLKSSEKMNFARLLQNDDFDGIRVFLTQIAKRWQQEKISQKSCEFSTKYLISELYHRYSELQEKLAIEDLLYRIEETVARSIRFEDFSDGVFLLLDELEALVRKSKQNKSVKDIVELLASHIENHYVEPFSIEQFAGQFGYNPTYLANQFAQVKGAAPNKMITKKRIQRAKELLSESSYLLKDIAEMVGYNDVSYFSRLFKDYTGESPKQYRERADH